MSGPRRILVCGSRTWTDIDLMKLVLGRIDNPKMVTLIEGGARGADAMAGRMGRYLFGAHERFPANWDEYGSSAGLVRNRQMLAAGVDQCFAFVDKPLPESRGTADMVSLCRKDGVATTVISAYTTPGRVS